MSESKKYLDFVEALKQLCEKHDVVLSTGCYEGLEVWDAKDEDGYRAGIHCAGIDDMTGEYDGLLQSLGDK